MMEEWKNLEQRDEKMRDKQTHPSRNRRHRKALYEIEVPVPLKLRDWRRQKKGSNDHLGKRSDGISRFPDG